MRYSAAFPTSVHRQATQHLLRADHQEDLCFCLWNPSQGANRLSACIRELLLPNPGDRVVHGNVEFTPQYFERVVAAARMANCGLALLHSHLGPGWQDMSPDDIEAERGHAAAAAAATGLPLVGLTLGTDGAWSARFWLRKRARMYARQWCESVRVVGSQIAVTFHPDLVPQPASRDELTRTVSAWGQSAQANLARLRIGVIGLGSVGAIVGETLARMGIAQLRLIDFDIVERLNLDRLLHATATDAVQGRMKVDMLAKQFKKAATAHPFKVEAMPLSVVEEQGFRAALDCDVLFSCVDRPWPRYVLNFIAYAHLIPVIDGGLHITPMSKDRGLKRATWRAHTVGPTRRCLECLCQYDPGLVAVERTGLLDKPTYIEGLPKDHELRQNENVFGFSLSVAALEVMQLLRMSIPHPGLPDIGAQTVHFVSGNTDSDTRPCDSGCPYPTLTALGDRTGVNDITGRHETAELRRSAQKRTCKGKFASAWSAFMRVALRGPAARKATQA